MKTSVVDFPNGPRLGLMEIEHGHDYEQWVSQLPAHALERLNNTFHPVRRREKIGTLIAFKALTGIWCEIIYDSHKKPHLKDVQGWISISHSENHVVAGLHERPFGVDIERIDKRVGRIKYKFLHPLENFFPESGETEILYLTWIWSSKEAIYKLFSERKPEFKSRIRVLPFQYPEDDSIFEFGAILDEKDHVKLRGKNIDGETLIVIAEKNDR